jgi:hypothetical protein
VRAVSEFTKLYYRNNNTSSATSKDLSRDFLERPTTIYLCNVRLQTILLYSSIILVGKFLAATNCVNVTVVIAGSVLGSNTPRSKVLPSATKTVLPTLSHTLLLRASCVQVSPTLSSIAPYSSQSFSDCLTTAFITNRWPSKVVIMSVS